MAETLASSLKTQLDPLSVVGQASRQPTIFSRGQAASKSLEPLMRGEQEAAAEVSRIQRTGDEEIAAKQLKQAQQAESRATTAMTGYEKAVGDAPKPFVQQANPNELMELAALTAILGGLAGATGGGRSALAAMEGISEGYKLGKQDVYERGIKDYQASLESWKNNVQLAKNNLDNYSKMEAIKKGSGDAEIKLFQARLKGTIAAAEANRGNIAGAASALKDMIKTRDAAEVKLLTAVKQEKRNFQKLLDAEGQIAIMDVSDPAFVPGEVGMGRGGFVGYAASPASSGLKGAKEAKDDASRKQGQRNFSLLTGQLRSTYNRLQQSGEIRDVNKPFMSNMYVYLATTVVGQEVQRMLGRAPQSDRDYTAGLRASLMNAIREATGLGSRSLDSNRELEFYLQAVTNPTATIQANMQALQDLEALYGNLKSIADEEGLDDASIIENAITTFGSHEPQKFKYSVSSTGQIQRTPRVRGQETAMPVQPAAQQQGVDQRAIAIGERYQRGEISAEQATQELRALGGFQ